MSSARPRVMRPYWVRALQRSGLGILGLAVLCLLIVLAVFAPYETRFSPTSVDLTFRHRPPGSSAASGDVYWLGTDRLGRDIFTRILYGLRISLILGSMVALVSGMVGLLLGSLAGYTGGIVEGAIMRFVDVQMSFPFLLLAIMWVAFFGPGLLNIILILTIQGWVPYARISHSLLLSLKRMDYVDAARAMGARPARILFRHILPQLQSSMIVIATFQVGRAIVSEATLSFLGLGVPPPAPTLGTMLSEGQGYLSTAWWEVAGPGLALTLIVLAVNALGDGLRDVLDPRLRQQV